MRDRCPRERTYTGVTLLDFAAAMSLPLNINDERDYSHGGVARAAAHAVAEPSAELVGSLTRKPTVKKTCVSCYVAKKKCSGDGIDQCR